MRRGSIALIVVCGVFAGWASAQDAFVGPVIVDEPSEAKPSAASADPASESDLLADRAASESRPLGAPGQHASKPLISGRGDGDGRPALQAGDGWWRTAGALALTLALIVAIAAGVRKWAGRSGGLMQAMGAGGRAPSGLLYVLGRYPVGRGQTLVLLKLDRRVLLVSQSAGAKGGGMRTLCELTDPEEVAAVVLQAGEAEGRTLGAKFREMVSGFESSHAEAESVMRPVEITGSDDAPSFGSVAGGQDAADRLHSRLDSLRRAQLETTA